MTTDTASPVLQTFPLGAQWPTIDPFLFVAHHDDQYPAGEADLGPDPAELQGRTIGSDFSQRDGCLLYTSPSPRDRQKSRMPSSA